MNGSRRRIAAATLALPLVLLSGCASPTGLPAQSPAPLASESSASESPASEPPASEPPASQSPGPRSPAPLSQQDTDALGQLAGVAPRTSTIDPALADRTECWTPSAHLIPAEEVGNATTWKVICRIYWHEKDGTPRYQDTNCIGDFAKQPMLDHCYRWVYYDYEPAFEDHPAVPASG